MRRGYPSDYKTVSTMKLLFLCLLLFSINAFSAASHEINYVPIGLCQTDSAMVASQALPVIPIGADFARISVLNANIFYKDDGSDAVVDEGIQLIADTFAEFYNGDLSKIRVIESGATAVMNVCYYK